MKMKMKIIKGKKSFKLILNIIAMLGFIAAAKNLNNKDYFSQSFVKATECCKFKGQIIRFEPEDFIKRQMENQPTEFLTGLRKGDLVCFKDVGAIYEQVKLLRYSSYKDHEKGKYEIYDILCYIAEMLLDLEKKDGVIERYKLLYNEWVNKNAIRDIEQISKEQRPGMKDSKKLNCGYIECAGDVCEQNVNVLNKLEAIKNALSCVEKFFEDYAVDDDAVYYLSRLNMYLAGWIAEFKELDAYYRKCFYIKKNSEFKPNEDCKSNSATAGGFVKRLKYLGGLFQKRDLGKFFKDKLVEPTIYSTSFKREELVSHENLVKFYSSSKQKLDSILGKILALEEYVNNSHENYIGDFKKTYNENLVILQKDEVNLTNGEREVISNLYIKLIALTKRLKCMYNELDIAIVTSNSQCEGCKDFGDAYKEASNRDRTALLYLNGWIRTLVEKEKNIRKKFSFLGESAAGRVELSDDFFYNKFDSLNEYIIDSARGGDKGKGKDKVLESYESLFYNYNAIKKYRGVYGSVEELINKFESKNKGENAIDIGYLKNKSCLEICKLVKEVMAFDVINFNKLIIKNKKYIGEGIKDIKDIIGTDRYKTLEQKAKEHNDDICKNAKNKLNDGFVGMIRSYRLKYDDMLPILRKLSSNGLDIDCVYDINKVLDLYKDTIGLMLATKKMYNDICAEIMKFGYHRRETEDQPGYVQFAYHACKYVKSLVLTFARIVKEISDKFSFVNKQEVLDNILNNCPPLILSEYSREDRETVKTILGSFKNVQFKNLTVRFLLNNSLGKRVKVDGCECVNNYFIFIDSPIKLDSFFDKNSDNFVKEFSGIGDDYFVSFNGLCRMYNGFCWASNILTPSNILTQRKGDINKGLCRDACKPYDFKFDNLYYYSKDLGSVDSKDVINNAGEALSDVCVSENLKVLKSLSEKEEFFQWLIKFCNITYHEILPFEGSFKNKDSFLDEFKKEYKGVVNVLKKDKITCEEKEQVKKIFKKITDLRKEISKIHVELLNEVISNFFNKFAKNFPEDFKSRILDNFYSFFMHISCLDSALCMLECAIGLKFHEFIEF